jgi:hypothetical protein
MTSSLAELVCKPIANQFSYFFLVYCRLQLQSQKLTQKPLKLAFLSLLNREPYLAQRDAIFLSPQSLIQTHLPSSGDTSAGLWMPFQFGLDL